MTKGVGERKKRKKKKCYWLKFKKEHLLIPVCLIWEFNWRGVARGSGLARRTGRNPCDGPPHHFAAMRKPYRRLQGHWCTSRSSHSFCANSSRCILPIASLRQTSVNVTRLPSPSLTLFFFKSMLHIHTSSLIFFLSLLHRDIFQSLSFSLLAENGICNNLFIIQLLRTIEWILDFGFFSFWILPETRQMIGE